MRGWGNGSEFEQSLGNTVRFYVSLFMCRFWHILHILRYFWTKATVPREANGAGIKQGGSAAVTVGTGLLDLERGSVHSIVPSPENYAWGLKHDSPHCGPCLQSQHSRHGDTGRQREEDQRIKVNPDHRVNLGSFWPKWHPVSNTKPTQQNDINRLDPFEKLYIFYKSQEVKRHAHRRCTGGERAVGM